MSGIRQPGHDSHRDLLEEAMAAHLFGEASPEQRRRLEVTLARSPDAQTEWESLSGFFDELGRRPLPEAGADFESDILSRLRARRGEDQAIATVEMTHGEVRRSAGKGRVWNPVEIGDQLFDGDSLRIGKGARALVRLSDRSELWINMGSALRIARREGATVVSLIRGELLALMEKQRSVFRVLTRDGAVEVLGTVFNARAGLRHGTRVVVLRGRVRVSAGSQGREVGSRGSVDLRGEQGLSRTRHLSVTETKRLGAWTRPIRSESKSAASSIPEEVHRQVAFAGAAKLLALIAVIGIALLVRGWRMNPSSGGVTSAATTPLRSATLIEERFTQARPLDLPAEVAVNPLPGVGDTWTQTTHLTGSLTTELSGPDGDHLDVRALEIALVSETRVLEEGSQGELRIEHAVRRADVHFSGNEGDRYGEDYMSQVLTGLQMVLRQSTAVEILDAEGRIVSTDLVVPDGAPRIHALPQTVVLPLLIFPVPSSDGVLSGDVSERSQRAPFPGIPGVTLVSESTLDRCEEIEGEPLAVIRSVLTAEMSGPIDLALSWTDGAGETVRNVGSRIPHRLQSDTLLWSRESHLSLTDGRRALSRGQIDQTYHLVRSLPPTLPAPRIADIQGRLHLETVAEIVHEP